MMTEKIAHLREVLLLSDGWDVDRRADALKALAEIEAAWDALLALVDVEETMTEMRRTIRRWSRDDAHPIAELSRPLVEDRARLAREVERLRESEMNALSGEADAIREREAAIDEIARLTAAPGEAWERLSAMRAAGWTVAVHNDYRLNGKPHTFWLFTRDGREVHGEGRTDAEALAACAARAAVAPTVGVEAITHEFRPGAQDGMPRLADVEAVGPCPVCGSRHVPVCDAWWSAAPLTPAEAREATASAPGQIGPRGKPFPMPGTTWRVRGADGPHVVTALRWFCGQVQAEFGARGSCAGVEHMMTLDAWVCEGVAPRALTQAETASLTTHAEILGGDSRPTIATHEIRREGDSAIVAEQWTDGDKVVKRYEVRLDFSGLVHMALNTTAEERAAIDERADWRGVDDANTHAPPRALTEAEARAWARDFIGPGTSECARQDSIAAALTAAWRREIPTDVALAAFRVDVPPKVGGVPAEMAVTTGEDTPVRQCVAVLATNATGEVLLVRTRRGWELPGGGVEPGESPNAAAAREVLEETGLAGLTFTAGPEELAGTVKPGASYRSRIMLYRATAEGEPKAGSDAERAEWWTAVGVLMAGELSDLDTRPALLAWAREASAPARAAEAVTWNEDAAARRGALIDRDLNGHINDAERAELAVLEARASAWMRSIAWEERRALDRALAQARADDPAGACNVDHATDERPRVTGGECAECLHRPPLHEPTCSKARCSHVVADGDPVERCEGCDDPVSECMCDEGRRARASEHTSTATGPADASTIERLMKLVEKLKRIEPCAAANIEGQRCVTADVRWCGRELARLVATLKPACAAPPDRLAALAAAEQAYLVRAGWTHHPEGRIPLDPEEGWAWEEGIWEDVTDPDRNTIAGGPARWDHEHALREQLARDGHPRGRRGTAARTWTEEQIRAAWYRVERTGWLGMRALLHGKAP